MWSGWSQQPRQQTEAGRLALCVLSVWQGLREERGQEVISFYTVEIHNTDAVDKGLDRDLGSTSTLAISGKQGGREIFLQRAAGERWNLENPSRVFFCRSVYWYYYYRKNKLHFGLVCVWDREESMEKYFSFSFPQTKGNTLKIIHLPFFFLNLF